MADCSYAGSARNRESRISKNNMADNYLEKKFEDMRARAQAKQAREQRARQRAWKKRMDAYRKKLEEQKQ